MATPHVVISKANPFATFLAGALEKRGVLEEFTKQREKKGLVVAERT